MWAYDKRNDVIKDLVRLDALGVDVLEESHERNGELELRAVRFSLRHHFLGF